MARSTVDAIVGANIRRHRAALALSVKELAARAGYSLGSVSNVERGEYSASLAMLCRIARELGIPAKDLLEGADTYHRVAEEGDIW